ncbi:hypothetical protein F5Y02DRAFT_421248 [Annulohypoxylon stygium]|nr:hypothetical protein F5Y02DRAFT_421248 [Annulohypoxylon stygium]
MVTPSKSTTTTIIGPALEISLTTSISPSRSDTAGNNGKTNAKMGLDSNAQKDRPIHIYRNDCRIIHNGNFTSINNLNKVRNAFGWVVTYGRPSSYNGLLWATWGLVTGASLAILALGPPNGDKSKKSNDEK